MSNEIKILCPGRKCGKCRRMIARVEDAVKRSNLEADIEIIDEIEKMMNYSTWILPTLIINDAVVARGYIPEIQTIQKYFRQ